MRRPRRGSARAPVRPGRPSSPRPPPRPSPTRSPGSSENASPSQGPPANRDVGVGRQHHPDAERRAAPWRHRARRPSASAGLAAAACGREPIGTASRSPPSWEAATSGARWPAPRAVALDRADQVGDLLRRLAVARLQDDAAPLVLARSSAGRSGWRLRSAEADQEQARCRRAGRARADSRPIACRDRGRRGARRRRCRGARGVLALRGRRSAPRPRAPRGSCRRRSRASDEHHDANRQAPGQADDPAPGHDRGRPASSIARPCRAPSS